MARLATYDAGMTENVPGLHGTAAEPPDASFGVEDQPFDRFDPEPEGEPLVPDDERRVVLDDELPEALDADDDSQ